MTEDLFIFPMSFAQQRLWFLDQLQPNSAFYNIPLVMPLEGELDVVALQQAIDEIVRRHEVLRTTFATQGGEPVQVVAPMADVRLMEVDLRSLSGEAQEAEAQRLADEEMQRPFDLRRGPLLRVTLLHLSDDEQLLLLTIHHIISDGWSMGILTHEVETLYDAFAEGEPSPLPELPIQYADFAVWQRDWLSGERLEQQLAYWREELADAPPLLALPTDRPRPPVQTFRGASEHFELNPTLAHGLKALSQKAGTTLFMTLLAGWGVFLSRYGGNMAEHVVIGSPIANRNRKEIEPLIGFFVNTLLFHLDFSQNPTFLQCLAQVRQKSLDAHEHQDLPFEKLVDELKPERNLSHSPLFQVMFVLQNAPPRHDEDDDDDDDEEPSDDTTLAVNPQAGTAKFDLTLMMDEEDLSGVWEYNTDLFDRTTIQRMHQHFERLLAAIVANPQQRVAELPLLTADERQKLLVEWNQTDADYPSEWCIHEWFESQVIQRPNAIAVAASTPSPILGGKSELTYHELNACANQFAHYLRRMGVKAEVPVAICAERSLEMIIGLLAILKAGGAYVPLDPSYPKERLAFVVEDALGEVKVLLTQQKLLDKLPDVARKAALVCLDTNVAGWQSEENPVDVVEPDNLAYIIYTSGSTGKPKGVQVSHQNLVHSTHARVSYYDEPPTSFLVPSSFAFDSSVAGIFWTLCTGGRLVLPPQAFQEEPDGLAELIALHQASYLLAIPSFYRLILTQVDLAKLSSLRAVIVAGEACPTELVKQHYECLPNATLFNEYGPTEATVWSTVYECRWPEKRSQVPIGRAIANAKLYILDDHLQPVPIGVPGQLYIGGVGVARGYLNRPKLSRERFIRNPFGPGKLYNSGDMARYLPDGNPSTRFASGPCIDFMGRIDNQVKIRGFRIELGEIHASLIQHANVREAVVIARQTAAGNKQLVGYFVPTEGIIPTSGDLRRYLLERLPDYMVPSAFVRLELIPLLPNGKVNRRALPAPEEARASETREIVAANTQAEQILSQIWAEVLNLDEAKIDIHDNFFELGGDSILSIQIVGRANRAGLHLTPRQLFQHQTIADLAAVAGTSGAIQAEQGIVSGAVPLTPIQQWFFELNQPEAHHYNHDVLLEVPADTQPALIKQVVQHLLTHHDALRLRFKQTATGWQQEHAAPTDDVPFSVIDLSHVPAEEQAEAIETAANTLQSSLNLSDGPLLRVAFFRLGANQTARLLIIVHHLVVDGVSWRILLEDLQTAYDAVVKGDTIQLPPKTTSFKAWATALREYAQSEQLVAENAYWLTQSHDVPLPRDNMGVKVPQTSEVLETSEVFPPIIEQVSNTTASAADVEVSLSVEETRTLLQEVPEVYKTQINDVLLTALVKAFANWTGDRSLLLDLEGHGREELADNEHLDLSRTVGWFTSAFPVYLTLGNETNVGQELQKIKEQLRSIPQRGIGYGLLRYLHPDAAIRQPLQTQLAAEVSFNYLGQFDQVTQDASLFEGADESSGYSQSLLAKRPYLLDVIGMVSDGMLQVSWTYSQNIHQTATIERLATAFIDALREIIEHCLSPDAGGRSWVDFDLAGIDNEALLEIAGQLADVDEE